MMALLVERSKSSKYYVFSQKILFTIYENDLYTHIQRNKMTYRPIANFNDGFYLVVRT